MKHYSDKPTARPRYTQDGSKYFMENEYDAVSGKPKTLQELCRDKEDLKFMKQGEMDYLGRVANKLVDGMVEAIQKFKKGEIDIIDLMDVLSAGKDKFKQRVEQEKLGQHLSSIEISMIWNNTIKRARVAIHNL